MKLYVATKNAHKLRELSQMLAGTGYEVVSAYTLVDPAEDVEETGVTFEENAIIKALALSEKIDGLVIADDSGLSVDALNGAPGVISARYAGAGATDQQNYEKLLEEMQNIPEAQRTARFECVIALARDGNIIGTFAGKCEGAVTTAPRGENGFGYDPIFLRPDGRVMAELSADEKNSISHRSQAVLKLKRYLETTPV